MARVEIYTKMGCPFCARAKALLERKGVEFTEYHAAEEPAMKEQMIERSGRRTYPQVFIDGRHIGGSDDLASFDQQGGLDPLLAA